MNLAVILIGFTLEPIVELGAGAAGDSKEVRKEGWKSLEHSILQTGEEERDHPKFGDEERVSVGRTLLDFFWLLPLRCATKSTRGEI